MQSLLRRIEIILLTSLLFFTVAGFLVPNQAGAQLKIKDPSTDQPLPVYSGVEGSLKDYLCVPGDTQAEQSTALADCVSKLYRFSITAGGVTLVFFLVIAGYLYITSGETGKGKAKGILLSALTGMGILLGSYALLSFVNPELVKIKPIQPPIFTATGLPSCEAVGFGVKCITSDGQVSNGGGVPGSANEAQYKELIAKYASQNNLEYCQLSALIQKESTFNKLIVSNPPPNSVNTSSGSAPSYNVNFTNNGHGIGLTQVFIYKGSTSRPGAEFGFNSALTVQDLIDPDKSISAGAYYFGNLMKKKNGNLKEAYRAYTGGYGDEIVNKVVEMYNACKLRSST